MSHDVPELFEREMGCTDAELRRALPGAVAPGVPRFDGASMQVAVGTGRLHLAWSALPPRRIALVTLPRLAVRFAFDGVAAAERTQFMRRFDLYTHRGGG